MGAFQSVICRLRGDAARGLFLRSGACAGGVLVRPVIMESTLISQMIRPDASARVCSPVTIAAQTPARCHRRNSEYTARQDP